MSTVEEQIHQGLPATPPSNSILVDILDDLVRTEISTPSDELPNSQSNPQEIAMENPQEQPQIQELSTENPQLPTEQTINDTSIDPSIDSLCDYCMHKEKYQTLINDYLSKIKARTGEKVDIPFIEEVALLLDVDEDVFLSWLEDVTHTELIASIKKIKLLQKVRLLKRVVGRFNPEGPIYLLEALLKITI